MATGVRRRPRGFRQAGSLVSREIREVAETRGFAVSRLLTHWPEIAGDALARTTRPVKVSYARGGLGGTLAILTSGAHAPMVEMQAERLRQRVNACYGYNAIARIRVTQTAPDGFAEGAAPFAPAPPRVPDPAPSAEAAAKAGQTVSSVSDPGLRDALEALGTQILSRTKQPKGST